MHDRLSDVRSEGTENEGREREIEQMKKTIRRRKLRDDDDYEEREKSLMRSFTTGFVKPFRISLLFL